MTVPASLGRPDRPLDVKVFAGSSSGIGNSALKAFHAAAKDAGEKVTLVDADIGYARCDVAVVYGFPKEGGGAARTEGPRRTRREVHAAHAGPLIVIESGLIGRIVEVRRRSVGEIARRWARGHFHGAYERINRDSHFRVAITGDPRQEPDFCNAASPADRWVALSARTGLRLEPWRRTGAHIVVIGQVPGDAALRGLDIIDWLARTVRELAAHTTRPIMLRPHPMTNDDDLRRLRALKLEDVGASVEAPPRGTVRDSLDGAWATVCHSSGAAIDSLLAGVPALTLSPANMAWPITGHDLASIEAPPMIAREQWLHDLCYAQWTSDEIRAGTVWARFRPRLVERLRRGRAVSDAGA